MSNDRRENAAGLDRMRRGFQTTLPTATTEGRAMAGPPADPLEEMLRQSLSKEAYLRYQFTGVISDEQVLRDASAWFAEADEYISRVAILRDERKDLFPESPCSGDDMRARLRRIQALERVRDEAQALTAAAERSLKVERADAVALADMHVEDLDYRSRRPMIAEKDRADILRAADFALKIWNARNARIQATRRDNERAQLELDRARSESRTVEAPQAPQAPQAPLYPAADSRLSAGPALPPPGKDGRRSRR